MIDLTEPESIGVMAHRVAIGMMSVVEIVGTKKEIYSLEVLTAIVILSLI